MLKVAEERCYSLGGKLVIFVEGKNVEELLSTDAKKLAIKYAEDYGMMRAGYDKHTGVYPIDAEGNGPEAYKDDANEMSRLGKVIGYRDEYTLQSLFSM